MELARGSFTSILLVLMIIILSAVSLEFYAQSKFVTFHKVTNLVFASQSTSNTIYHHGDLIVKGNETYVIENVTLFIDGNIIVRDSARLIIRNANIIVNNTYALRYRVRVLDNASLEVENSTLTSAPLLGVQLWVRTREIPGAKLVMFNTKCYWDLLAMGGNTTIVSSRLPSLYWRGYWKSKVSVTNSSLSSVALSFGEHREDISITGLKSQVKLERIHIEAEGGVLELEKVSVGEWIVDLIRTLNPDSKLRLTINNSHISLLQLWAMEDAYLKFSNLKPGVFVNWSIRQNVQGLGPWSNLTLINTRVDAFKLLTEGKIEVENMEGIRIATSLNASVIIKNSKVTRDFHLLGNDFIRLINTTITQSTFWIGPVDPVQYTDRGPVQVEDAHVIEFSNSTISDVQIQVASRYTLMKGEVFIFTSMDHVNWIFGTITREYPLIVRDECGNPLPNASIKLVDPENNLIWNGMTDQKGMALFNITFTKDNYREEWTLIVTACNATLSQKVGFLTSTPIMLRIPSSRYTISFYVRDTEGNPISGATLIFADAAYYDRQNTAKAAGTYSLSTGTIPSSYQFDHWGTSGGVSIEDPSTSSTTATVSGDGSIAMVLKKEVAQVMFSAVGLSGQSTGTVLIVDGMSYTEADLPVMFAWEVGSEHNFSWSSPIASAKGSDYRFVWDKAEGLSTFRSGAVIVPPDGGIITPYYREQAKVVIAASPPEEGTTDPPPGEYWYDVGSTAGIAAHPSTGWRFDHWELDGADVGATNPITVTMDSPHELVAVFTTAPVPVASVETFLPYVIATFIAAVALLVFVLIRKR